MLAPVSAYISALLIIVFIFLRRVKPEKDTFSLIQFLLLLSAFISSIFAVHKGISALSSLVIIIYILSFLAGSLFFREEKDLIEFLTFYSISMIIYSVIGIAQFIKPFHLIVAGIHIIDKPYPVRRITSLLHNPLILASYYYFFFPFLLRYLKRKKILFSIALIIGGIAFVFTQSRAPTMALAVILFSYGLLKKRYAYAFISVGVLTLIVLLFEPLRIRFLSTFSSFNDVSRIFTYWVGIRMFIEHNPITGIGINNFAILLKDYASPDIYHPYIHSMFLSYLVEAGIIGFTILVWMFVKIYIKLVKVIRHGDGLSKDLSIILFSSFTGMLFHNLMDNTIYVVGLAIIYWFFIGVIKGLRHAG